MWSTEADSVAFNALRPGRSAWAALTTAQQAQWLTAANDLLANLEGYAYPSPATIAMQSAEMELAWLLYSAPPEVSELLPLIQAGVTRYHINSVDVYMGATSATPEIPKKVLSYLFPYRGAGLLGPGRASTF